MHGIIKTRVIISGNWYLKYKEIMIQRIKLLVFKTKGIGQLCLIKDEQINNIKQRDTFCLS